MHYINGTAKINAQYIHTLIHSHTILTRDFFVLNIVLSPISVF